MKIVVSPDTEVVNLIRQGLKETGGYCPCRVEKTEENRCMCQEFLKQDVGPCHCGLYIKTEK